VVETRLRLTIFCNKAAPPDLAASVARFDNSDKLFRAAATPKILRDCVRFATLKTSDFGRLMAPRRSDGPVNPRDNSRELPRVVRLKFLQVIEAALSTTMRAVGGRAAGHR
jgi:hypothetical protein